MNAISTTRCARLAPVALLAALGLSGCGDPGPMAAPTSAVRTSPVATLPSGTYPGVELETTTTAPAPSPSAPEVHDRPETTPPPTTAVEVTDDPRPPVFELVGYFPTGSCDAVVAETLAAAVDEAATVLPRGAEIEVHGWVDERGDPDAMTVLSQCRASHVADALFGLRPDLDLVVIAHGVGDLRFPDCPGNCPQNRAVTGELAPDGHTERR